MKKILIRIAIVLAVLIVVALVVVFASLNSIVKKGVETVGPQLTKVEVRLGGVKLSPFSGSGQLSQMFVGNPDGYKTPSAILVGDVKVDVDVGSLLSDTIVVESINVQAPEITFEGGLGGNNLKTILKNLEAAGGGEQPGEPAGADTKSGKHFFVRDVVMTGGKINLSVTGLGGQAMTVPLPDVHIQNIGTKNKGVTAAQMTKQIMVPLLESVLKAAGEAMGDLGKGVKSLGTDGGKQVEGITKGIQGLFKGPSKTDTNTPKK